MSNSTPKCVTRFFSSWSGGKDSCLALYRALNHGYSCASLFTMINEHGTQSRSHGLSPNVLQAQAEAMDIPLQTTAATWDSYETHFKNQITHFKKDGILHGVFGDIDLEPHREWVMRVCDESGITGLEPLWQEARRDLVNEFISAGFQALIVVVNTKKMPERFLGRVIDSTLIDECEALGVDACGENGEFHSFVFDGPLFKNPVQVIRAPVIKQDEYVFLPLTTYHTPTTAVGS